MITDIDTQSEPGLATLVENHPGRDGTRRFVVALTPPLPEVSTDDQAAPGVRPSHALVTVTVSSCGPLGAVASVKRMPGDDEFGEALLAVASDDTADPLVNSGTGARAGHGDVTRSNGCLVKHPRRFPICCG